MTLREWCVYTANVYPGACDAYIFQTDKPPICCKVGFIPDEVATKQVQYVNISKMNPDTNFIYEIEVRLDD